MGNFSPSLSIAAVTIYQTLTELSCGNSEPYCVGYRQLVERSGYCRTTVIHAVKELTWRGWVKKHTTFDETEKKLRNVYELLR